MSFSLTPTSGGRFRRSIRQNDQIRKQVVKINGNILPVIPNTTPFIASQVPGWSMATSPSSNPRAEDGISSISYRAASTQSEIPFEQASRPSHRYQLRGCPPSGPVTPWTLNPNEQTEIKMLVDDNHRSRKKATSVEETSPEIKQLRKEIKAQKISISSYQRRLAAANRIKTRYEAQKAGLKHEQKEYQRRYAEWQRAYSELDKKFKELEKVNQRLAYHKGIDDEVRNILMTQHEKYKDAWDVTMEKWFANKLKEIKKDTGCEVIVTRIMNTRTEGVDDLRGLHISMMSHLKILKDQAKQVKITKIEYILNHKLHHEFKEAKAKLKEAGRSTDEVILFHGTESKNIEPIVSDGFRIGGIDGFMASHGSSMGNGVYCTKEAQNTMYYQCTYGDPNPPAVGTRRIIGLRVLPGTTSPTYCFGKPKEIGVEEFDCHHSSCGIYVVRRACQTLPCFVVYY